MKHIHLLECRSTQTFLQESIERNGCENIPLLVSASRQTEGRGRGRNQWVHSDNALAFSLALGPHPEPTLTPLEVGSILINYFQQQTYQLYLKWPNDLLNSQGQKCGGILCSLMDGNTVVVGIGINLGKSDFQGVPRNTIVPGHIDDKKILIERDKQDIPLDISQYIIKNRMTAKQVLQTWNDHCFHQKKKVLIGDGNSSIGGLFQGITPKGEAIIESNGIHEYVTTGSLVICN